MGQPSSTLRVVAWETTRRCPLACRHCRGSARDRAYSGELSTAEGMRFIDALATGGPCILILTGGEPMVRADIYDLAAHATASGLRVAMAPCGPLLTAPSVSRIMAAGIQRISVSFDGATAATHDRFRGTEGAFAAAVRGVGYARAAGLAFQINTTVTRLNVDDIPAIRQLAADLGAVLLDLFFLVPTGRGSALADLALDADAYDEALRWVAEHAEGGPVPLKTTCAPHIVRVRHQLGFRDASDASPGGGRHGSRGPAPGGCMAGRGFLFVSHTGVLQPCGFLDVPCGDLRSADFDVHGLYTSSEVFRALRRPDTFGGACGVCEFRTRCGGCRARAYAATGDYLAAEPSCSYVPAALREHA